MPVTLAEEDASIVEGIGNEVLLFGSSFVALFIVLLTWLYLTYFNSEVNSAQEQRIPHPSESTEVNSQQSLSADSPSNEAQDENDVADHSPSEDPEPAAVAHSGEPLGHAEESSSRFEELEPGEDEDCSPEELRQRRLEFYSRNEASVNESAANDAGEDSGGHDLAQAATRNTLDGAAGDAQGSLTVRLKYLNDTERCVTGRQHETLGEFRRRHFEDELSSRRVVRLIFNGAQLSNDAATLYSCGICDGCVVHVHISAMPASSNSPPQRPAELDLNLSALMWPLFATILGILWYFFFQYKELFNLTSTTILMGISGLFCVGLYGQYYTPPQVPASQ